MKVLFLFGLFIIGAIFGSFACCQAWRLRYKSQGKPSLGNRSVCMRCGAKLKWSDNIPIISWLILGGRCRYCHHKIGIAEILSEIGLALAFLLIGLTFWGQWILLTAYSIFAVLLCILAVYDAKWGELPLSILLASVIMGVAILICNYPINWLSAIGGIAILSGTYFLLYIVSNEKWVGGGDWILGLALSLALSNWWLSLWVLFIANISAVLIAMPISLKKHQNKIHFGPFLIVSFILVLAFAKFINGLIFI